MAAKVKYSVLDLTADQVEQIETDVGLPLTNWQSAPSAIAIAVKVLAVATGRPESEFRAMRVRDMLDMVSLGDDDPEG